jgi:hypothetical protein
MIFFQVRRRLEDEMFGYPKAREEALEREKYRKMHIYRRKAAQLLSLSPKSFLIKEISKVI